MSKVVCIGESIVDIIPNDGRYVLTAGGAPVNVCACVSALGGKAYFLGNISNDAYGVFLYDEIKKCGIDTKYITRDSNHKSAISFVSLKDGDRSFEFFRENTADIFLSEDDIDDDMFESGDVLHFCSVCLVDSPIKRAHKKAIDFAKKNGAFVSFDLNMRPALWTSEEDMLSAILKFLPYADIIKMSIEERYALSQYINSNGKQHSGNQSENQTGMPNKNQLGNQLENTEIQSKNQTENQAEETEKQSIQRIFDVATSCKLLILTKGSDGSTAYDRNLNHVSCSAVKANVVDTTGAGDCFIGSLLYLISTNKLHLTPDSPQKNVIFDNNTQNQIEVVNKSQNTFVFDSTEHNINGFDKTQFDKNNQNSPQLDRVKTALQFASSACALEIADYGGLRSMRRLKGLTFME